MSAPLSETKLEARELRLKYEHDLRGIAEKIAENSKELVDNGYGLAEAIELLDEVCLVIACDNEGATSMNWKSCSKACEMP